MSLPTPTLHIARLRLRPVTSADADALFALHSSAHVLPLLGRAAVERARAGRALHRVLPADGGGRQWGEAGNRARFGWGVHRMVRFDPMEPGVPQRIAGLLPR